MKPHQVHDLKAFILWVVGIAILSFGNYFGLILFAASCWFGWLAFSTNQEGNKLQ